MGRPDLRLIPTVSKAVALDCLMCHAVRQGHPGDTYPRLQARLRDEGWLCIGSTDVCPACRAKGTE